MKLYLGRHEEGAYEIAIRKPHWILAFCSKDWHKFTGIRLKKGEVREVKITKLKSGFKFEVKP